jgi:hypothetical protein
MTNKDDKRIDDILNSFKGSQRAKPRPELLKAIEEEIYANESSKIISFASWSRIAAAIALVLALNGTTLFYLSGKENLKAADNMESMPSLISDYKFYE